MKKIEHPPLIVEILRHAPESSAAVLRLYMDTLVAKLCSIVELCDMQSAAMEKVLGQITEARLDSDTDALPREAKDAAAKTVEELLTQIRRGLS